MLNTPNLICPHKDLILNALSMYSEKKIDYYIVSIHKWSLWTEAFGY